MDYNNLKLAVLVRFQKLFLECYFIQHSRNPKECHDASFSALPIDYNIDIKFLQFQLLWLFPGKVGIFSSEMSIGGRLAEDGASEVEVSDDGTRTQIKVLFDNLGQIGVGHALLGGSVRVDKDRERVVDSNRVRELH